MAQGSRSGSSKGTATKRKTTTSAKKTGTRSSSSKSSSKRGTTRSTSSRNRDVKNLVTVDDSIKDEAILLCILAVCILVYVALFGKLGAVGGAVQKFLYGLFGIMSFVLPIIVFVSSLFYVSNRGKSVAYIKIIAGIVLFLFLAALSQMMFGKGHEPASIGGYYKYCGAEKCGGGLVGGAISFLFIRAIGKVGTYILLFILVIACVVIITEKSFFMGVKRGSETIYNQARDNNERYRENREIRRRQREDYLREHPEEDKKLRREKVVSGLSIDTKVSESSSIADASDMTEIHSDKIVEIPDNKAEALNNINVKTVHSIGFNDDYVDDDIDIVKAHSNGSMSELYTARETNDVEIYGGDIRPSEVDSIVSDMSFRDARHSMNETSHSISVEQSYEAEEEIIPQPVRRASEVKDDYSDINIIGENIEGAGVKLEAESQTEYEDSYVKLDDRKPKAVKKPIKKTVYKFPPLDLLKKGKKNENTETVAELKETAAKLQSTLETFGVKVKITDIAQGPSVTRYEMQPEVGTKVSKITGLTDDIKLNMAARDIRIEAPIPGKAAVGIEIPNREVSTVMFRDLIDTKTFREASSKISFAVGKDLSGDTVVADIGKMPHMLIAGATGSGKSVCINTLIMSIIYKARPDEVKLIMIDPKVVELSVYNGIPHLMIPVVTDPKKAASALNWGVAEMTDRYNKFAEYGVRDLKGYNKKIESMTDVPKEDRPELLPQIIIIVDELADLMMVASNEVEESICRLAQLARAAGIHLIIATQRPSVDVITGLIKANMPSRVAFSVSSGTDSRTILDMNGAERLLGKGDMLFYPQGYTKPARVQGAFISDEEINDIVDFLKENNGGEPSYNEEVLAKVNAAASDGGSSSSGASSGSFNDRDDYFIEAAKLAIEQDKASIGYFQRKFKIGFNRAARIMDQLYEAGIVAAEEGTKPRKVLMSMEAFENALEQGEL